MIMIGQQIVPCVAVLLLAGTSHAAPFVNFGGYGTDLYNHGGIADPVEGCCGGAVDQPDPFSQLYSGIYSHIENTLDTKKNVLQSLPQLPNLLGNKIPLQLPNLMANKFPFNVNQLIPNKDTVPLHTSFFPSFFSKPTFDTSIPSPVAGCCGGVLQEDPTSKPSLSSFFGQSLPFFSPPPSYSKVLVISYPDLGKFFSKGISAITSPFTAIYSKLAGSSSGWGATSGWNAAPSDWNPAPTDWSTASAGWRSDPDYESQPETE